MKLLLFDVDGTILLTGGAGVKGMERAGVMCFGNAFSLKQVKVAGGMDPLIYVEATALAGVENAHLHHDRFRDTYLVELQERLAANSDKVRLLPGIGQLIHGLRKRDDVTIGLLTGNYTAAIPIKLKAVGMDPAWFPITAFGDEAADRPALVRLARNRYQEMTGQEIPNRDTIIIGDTPNDINCAHVNGCKCFAVATGLYSVADLRRAGADIVVSDLADPSPLHEMLANHNHR
jgi:phosphoglycolate phosphatase-like HAD superfamily hydrolase